MVQRDTWSWYSPNLKREMPIARFGHYGKPLVLFPTGGGDFLEHERFLMIRALSPLIEAGRLKVYTVDNINRDAWINADAPPWHKSFLQARWDDYLKEEVFPFIRKESGGTDQKFAASGASLGAYNAVNVTCKHPDQFDLAITMSGTFNLQKFMGKYFDQNFYYNNPLSYVPNLQEGPQLAELRKAFFVLAVGRGPWDNPDNSYNMGKALTGQAIPHRVEVWSREADHDWPTWRTMLPLFLNRLI